MFCATTGSMRAESENSTPLRGGSVQRAQKNGDSHKTDYTGVGFETRSFFPCVRAGRPEDIVYHTSTVESQSQTYQLLRPLSHAQRAPDGTAPFGKFTSPWQVSTGW